MAFRIFLRIYFFDTPSQRYYFSVFQYLASARVYLVQQLLTAYLSDHTYSASEILRSPFAAVAVRSEQMDLALLEQRLKKLDITVIIYIYRIHLYKDFVHIIIMFYILFRSKIKEISVYMRKYRSQR